MVRVGVAVVILLAGCPSKKSNQSPDAGPRIDAAMPDARTRFSVGGRVDNLLGTGLVLQLDAGETLAIAADGTFTFPTQKMTGTTFAVTVMTQPTTPAQTCTVTAGSGTIASADITSVRVACSVGNLRINEVGACFAANIACWFEVRNASATVTEQLSDYTLRSLGVDRSGGSVSEHVFTLPSAAIPPGGYLLVRGRASADVFDGPGIRTVLDGTLVPTWGAAGFIELLRSGKTLDFVKFGAVNANPTTIGWSGAAVSMLPSGTMTYGFAIARNAVGADTDALVDWSARAFGTPGGVNDITTDTDADLDGIPDQAEVSGGTFAGLDLFAMGARTAQRDIFIEIDRMTSADPGITPQRAGIDKLVAAFAPHGIAIHVDAGTLFAASFDPASYNLGGGNTVPFSPGISIKEMGDGRANVYQLKATHMDVRRHAVFHYMMYANSQNVNGSAGNGGVAELDGNDIIVSLGSNQYAVDTAEKIQLLANYQAGTMMHELGHNLGLKHGGDEDVNYKPNHISVMNYTYAYGGLPVLGTAAGDRYFFYVQAALRGVNCGITDEHQLQLGPFVAGSVVDFSNGASGIISEAAVDESQGLRRTGSTSVDFNCSGGISTVAYDVNFDGASGMLHDYDEWTNLKLPFVRFASSAQFVEGAPRLDPFTDEQRPIADETGYRPPRR